jgi:hypothetical protein
MEWGQGARSNGRKRNPSLSVHVLSLGFTGRPQATSVRIESLRPQSDEADNFVIEAQRIIRYRAAVATMGNEAEKVGEDVVYELHSLIRELADEANRRLERAQDALEIVWAREEQAKKATLARKAGV